MNVLPVIVRELRAGARQRATYWLRVLGAAFVVLVFAVVMLDDQSNPATLGAKLFTRLHTAIFIVIWLLVPGMTADCLAREKREGTLGLLFLTPLTPAGIVVGKSLVHLLKAMTLWLAAVPIMTLPLLLGGLTWLDICTAFVLEFCAVILALSAGIFASARSKVWGRALVSAQLVSLGLAVLFGWFLSLATAFQIVAPVRNFHWQELLSVRFLAGMPLILTTGLLPGNWNELFTGFPPAASQMWLVVLGETLLFCLLIFGSVIWLAARQVRRSWQDGPASARKRWLFRTFTVPVLWRDRLRRNSRRALDRNPIAWLHQCSWSARLTKWGWCLGFVLVECVPLNLWSDNASPATWWEVQTYLMLALSLGLTFVAAGSFIKEKENGVLELLLVSPLPLHKLIYGRVLGLWEQFLPSALVIALASVMTQFGFAEWDGYGTSSNQENVQFALVVFMGFFTLPFIGLYWSLRLKRLWTAWLLIWVMGGFLPLAFGIPLGDALAIFLDYLAMPTIGDPICRAIMICLSQIAFARLACFLLRHSLSRRIYPFT